MILKRVVLDKVLNTYMIFSICVVMFIPLFIGVGLYLKSDALLNNQSLWHLITESDWQPSKGNFGFLPFITSSLYVTVIAFILTAPVCLLTGIYLTQFTKSRMMKIMLPVIDILAGLPSVIYGVWGVLIIVPFVANYIAPLFNISSSGYSILAAGVVLAVMCVPYMLNMIIEVFKTVPIGLKEAALSLGATNWQVVKQVVIKKCYPGIISSFGLGVAKAFGETMAVMMVVGNSISLTCNPLKAGYPLPALIANNYGEMLSIPLYDSALMFAALLLFGIILIINLVFRYFIYQLKEQ